MATIEPRECGRVILPSLKSNSRQACLCKRRRTALESPYCFRSQRPLSASQTQSVNKPIQIGKIRVVVDEEP
jgi:hypothetical protein